MNIARENAKECIGNGWSELIDAIYDKLPEDAFVSQVKEKYGGLRFYVYGIDDETQDYIEQIEQKSLQVCEYCGDPGKPRPLSWVKTLCEEHFNEYRLKVQKQTR